MMEEFVKIEKWKVPKKLFDEYIKWRLNSDGYLNKTIKTPGEELGINLPSNDAERSMRYQLCVKKVMEIHRAICLNLGIEYTEKTDDDFYKAFHKEVTKQTKLKG